MIKEFLQFKAREAFLLGIRQAQELTESLQAREDNIKHIRTVSFFFFLSLELALLYASCALFVAFNIYIPPVVVFFKKNMLGLFLVFYLRIK